MSNFFEDVQTVLYILVSLSIQLSMVQGFFAHQTVSFLKQNFIMVNWSAVWNLATLQLIPNQPMSSWKALILTERIVYLTVIYRVLDRSLIKIGSIPCPKFVHQFFFSPLPERVRWFLQNCFIVKPFGLSHFALRFFLSAFDHSSSRG